MGRSSFGDSEKAELMPYLPIPSEEEGQVFLGPTRTEEEWQQHLQDLRNEGVSESAVGELEKMGRLKFAQRLLKTWRRCKLR